MRKNLTFFEKFLLCFRGIVDALRHNVSVNNNDIDCEICVSAFITDELTKMFIHSKNVFFRRYCVMLFDHKKNTKRYHIIKFFDIIALIDKYTSNVMAEIIEMQLPYNVQKEKFCSLREIAVSKNATHLVRMYDNIISDLEMEKENAVNKSYKMVESLLNEKISILKRALAYQDSIQCKYLLRIQYYYDKVCQFDKKYPVISLNIENYSNKIDMSFLEYYREQLKDTESQLDNVINRRNSMQ